MGGDEVGAVVIEIGTHSTRAGFAGEDSPKAVFPSSIGSGSGEGGKRSFYVGSQSLSTRRDNVEVVNPIGDDGLVRDWEAVEQIYDHSLRRVLCVEGSEHPILAVEHAAAGAGGQQQQEQRVARETFAEMLFEKAKTPAMFLARSAVLTAFASAKSSALVVDCGASSLVVTPVHEGYALRRSALVSPLAGNRLTSDVLAAVAARGVVVRPRFSFRRKEVRPGEWQVVDTPFPSTATSYSQYCVREIAEDIKHTLCRVAPRTDQPAAPQPAASPSAAVPFASASASSSASATTATPARYELPDGTSFELAAERESIPELLFNPAAHPAGGPALRGVHQLVMEVIAKCDIDIRQTMYSSVILTGAGGLLPGFAERLAAELRAATPLFKGKLIVPSNAEERKFATWIGGSILASLGTFHQLWVSKKDYDESGKGIIEKKCP